MKIYQEFIVEELTKIRIELAEEKNEYVKQKKLSLEKKLLRELERCKDGN